ncbi:thioesterase II family protein [Streptomyces sp. NPDC093250]|uniref:thioesterase II family protein n=1 Tax=Streptomyces sp. NPDC093250 TaxID=3366036 RepID=UPI0037FB0AD6
MHPTTLICLPFAGAGASFFRKWSRLTPEGLTLLPVQLPGREERITETPFTDVGAAMDEACPWVCERLDDQGRVALFGHSLGAELAHELTRRLAARGVLVTRLFVSGAHAPRDRSVERISALDDAHFVAGLRRVAGFNHPAMNDPEMLEIMLPLLRADSRMHEEYHSRYLDRLNVPITSLRGADDTLISAGEAVRWAEETSAGFDYVEIDGSHMYLTDHAADLLAVIATALQQAESGSPVH